MLAASVRSDLKNQVFKKKAPAACKYNSTAFSTVYKMNGFDFTDHTSLLPRACITSAQRGLAPLGVEEGLSCTSPHVNLGAQFPVFLPVSLILWFLKV